MNYVADTNIEGQRNQSNKLSFCNGNVDESSKTMLNLFKVLTKQFT